MATSGSIVTVDPVTLEVIRNKLDVIADEMELTLLRSAYSSIVKEGLDASAAIFDTAGNTIAQSTSIPVHLGSLVGAVRAIIQTYPPATMVDGDVYIMNDPYAGGTHLPDVAIVVPIVYRGQVVALGCSMAHHQDLGGKNPGSVPPDATELYQEGLIIPPLKLYEAGKPNATLQAMIRRNVRIPDIVMGDFRAQVAAGRSAGERLRELFDRYGAPTMLDAMQTLLDRAELMTRDAIAQMPDGTYTFEDYLDNDGVDLDRPITIRATVTIHGSDLTVDFTGSSPQVRGPFNCVPSSTLAAVYYAIKSATDPAIPNNSGCFRPIRVVMPEGSIVNARPPAPVSCRTATIIRIADTVLGALVQALPARIPAAGSGQLTVIAFGGVDPRTGRPYVTSELGAGGYGARPNKDGIDVIESSVSNCMNIPAEAVESDFPLRIVKWKLWDGSGGAGRFRGGLGFEKVFRAIRGDVTVSHRGERYTSVPWGLFGGLPGRAGRAFVQRADGTREEIPSKRLLVLHEGDELHVFTAGGAGHGDPLTRPPADVLRDVQDRKITVDDARDLYGVVVDAEATAVDESATARLRATRRAARGPITWTYDRGPRGRV